jgi:sugar lactone lactonase YvrE
MQDEVHIKCPADIHNRLAESPVWDAPNYTLFWCDIPLCDVHALDLASGRHRHWRFDKPVGSLGLAQSGRIVVAVADTVHLFDLAREELTPLARVLRDWPTQRLNDGKVGPDGAFWVGSMDSRPRKEPIAALYRVTAGGEVTRKIECLKVSNGLAWSRDGRVMFHSDSHGRWIDRWKFDSGNGEIAARQRICTLSDEEGRPDGGATDIDDVYWSAGVSASCLNCFDFDGRLRKRIQLPIPRPTMACFGGSDMRTLFVTSMRDGLNSEQLRNFPQSGGVFFLRADVPGTTVCRFAD